MDVAIQYWLWSTPIWEVFALATAILAFVGKRSPHARKFWCGGVRYGLNLVALAIMVTFVVMTLDRYEISSISATYHEQWHYAIEYSPYGKLSDLTIAFVPVTFGIIFLNFGLIRYTRNREVWPEVLRRSLIGGYVSSNKWHYSLADFKRFNAVKLGPYRDEPTWPPTQRV